MLNSMRANVILEEIGRKFCSGNQEIRNRRTQEGCASEATTSNAFVSCDGSGYDWSDQGEEGPTNFALMDYSSTSSTLEEFTSEPIVIKPVVENSEAKASEAKPKAVRKNNGALDQGVIDSGCLRHMTGNMSYLTNFEEINGGYVALLEVSLKEGNSQAEVQSNNSGPNWLFNIDALTKSMYYKPVVVGKTVYMVIQLQKLVMMRVSHVARFILGDDETKVTENQEIETNEVNAVSRKASIELLDDPNMPALEDIVYSDDDEDVGAEADMNNLDAFMPVSPIPTTRIHKDHPVEQIIRDLNSAPQTRRMTKNLEEHEPKKVIHALKDPSWIEAMQEELLQFKNKKDERGIVIKNKARLVAQGYTQEEGIDYDEVFTLVARIEVIRLFLAYASFKDFVVYQMDVKSAFLYGKIEEEVYVCQPPGFEDPDFPNRVYKVEKALYGLHQAPRAWYETLSTYLLDNGFQRGKIDKTLFIRRDKGDILLVQVYVDDIIFGSTKKSLCTEFEKMMHKKFQMSSMGELTFFLGLQVKQKNDGIFISQDKYVTEILKKFSFTDVKTASTPMETQKLLLKDEDGEEVDVHLYRSMIGSLMYLTSSRPDIMFAVCACARYQVNPKISHLHAIKRIFRYLKGQPKLGLWYPKDSPFDLVAYTDSDYARASLDRKSTTGEAEYVAASSCCGQVLWIQNQLLDYGEKKLIQMVKIHTDKNVADLLTKAFDLNPLKVGFEQIVDFLNVHTIRYAITINPTIYTSCIKQFWATAKVKTVNGEVQLQALVDGKKIIVNEASVRRDLQLNDEEGMDCLLNATIFEELTRIGTMASAIICLATNQKFNFSKYIFEIMVKNLDNVGKFLMYPRSRRPKRKDTKIPQSSVPNDNAAHKVVNEEMDDSLERAATTDTSLDVEQDRGNINKTQSKATPNESSSLGTSLGGSPRRQETIGDTIAQTSDLAGEEVFVAEQGVPDSNKDNVAQVNTATTTVSTASTIPVSAALITNVEITLAQELVELKSAKPTTATSTRSRAKRLIIHEQEQAPTPIVYSQQPSHAKIQDKGKAKMIKPEPAKIEVDQLLAERLQAREQKELTIEERAILFQQLLEKRRKHFAAKREEEKRNRPPTKAQ
ncbi:putative ribonuclease H-like domain-containing protein [Tanacetum coccineum]